MVCNIVRQPFVEVEVLTPGCKRGHIKCEGEGTDIQQRIKYLQIPLNPGRETWGETTHFEVLRDIEDPRNVQGALVVIIAK